LGVNHVAEGDAGAALFQRLATGLITTPLSGFAISHVSEVKAHMPAVSVTLKEQGADQGGPVSVTAPPLLMDFAMAQDIADFMATHPKVRVKFPWRYACPEPAQARGARGPSRCQIPKRKPVGQNHRAPAGGVVRRARIDFAAQTCPALQKRPLATHRLCRRDKIRGSQAAPEPSGRVPDACLR